MNSSRKTATNWLSAIGYRQVLGVLVSAFAATAFAADCKVNDSDIGVEYVGDCVSGLAHGKGKAKGIHTYEGEFKQGFMHGKGKYEWADAKYEGDWINGKITGRGIYLWKSGAKYEGDFLNNGRSGKGVYVTSNGDKTIGDWFNDKENGKNETVWSDGDKYVGEKQNGKFHNFGKLTIRRENSKRVELWIGKGKWVGDVYVVEGIFDQGNITLSCTSPQNCKQENAKREDQERRDQAARGAQSSQTQSSNSGRGGLRELVFLEATKAYAARCNNGNSDVFERTTLGQYCGGSSADGFKCFSTPSSTAQHICK